MHGVQKQVSSLLDKKEWLRLQKQMRERALQRWDQIEKQEASGEQRAAKVTWPRAHTEPYSVKYEPRPKRG